MRSATFSTHLVPCESYTSTMSAIPWICQRCLLRLSQPLKAQRRQIRQASSGWHTLRDSLLPLTLLKHSSSHTIHLIPHLSRAPPPRSCNSHRTHQTRIQSRNSLRHNLRQTPRRTHTHHLRLSPIRQSHRLALRITIPPRRPLNRRRPPRPRHRRPRRRLLRPRRSLLRPHRRPSPTPPLQRHARAP